MFVSQREIARIFGVARESVARAFVRLTTLGAITTAQLGRDRSLKTIHYGAELAEHDCHSKESLVGERTEGGAGLTIAPPLAKSTR